MQFVRPVLQFIPHEPPKKTLIPFIKQLFGRSKIVDATYPKSNFCVLIS